MGMSVSGETGYEKAFGIALNKRSIQPIVKGTQNLVTDVDDGFIVENGTSEWSATQEADLRAQADQWFEKQQLLNKEQSMGSQVQKMAAGVLSGVLLTAIAPEVDASPKYAVGTCLVVQMDKEDNLSPIIIAENYIYKYQRNNPKFKSISSEDFGGGAKVTVLSQPKLGEIEETKYNWLYIPPKPNADGTYVEGRDHFVMKVENKGVAVFVHYYIEVVGEEATTYYGDDGQRLPHFCKRETWKISQFDFNPGTQDYAAWLRSSELSTLIATASQSLTGFQNLAGSAVGTTVGQGPTAQITLDSTAAGHGWYVDATPLDNTDDYLPTSNPDVWQAKAGTDAAGKMDLLSVLLHEYGHALGLEHSADSGDYMAATLQTGQRPAQR